MRNRNGYGLVEKTTINRPQATSPRQRRPVTARGRQVLENSRKRLAGN